VRWRCPRTPPQPYPFVVVVQRSPVWRSWNYLKAILEVFGFDLRWIYWIMPFISSPNYFILLNGVPSTPFNATWGLRQGDPLSPFLFIIAAEGLGWHIKIKIQGGQLKGLNLWGAGLKLSHQQFADDFMLFYQATLKESKVQFYPFLKISWKPLELLSIMTNKMCLYLILIFSPKDSYCLPWDSTSDPSLWNI